MFGLSCVADLPGTITWRRTCDSIRAKNLTNANIAIESSFRWRISDVIYVYTRASVRMLATCARPGSATRISWRRTCWYTTTRSRSSARAVKCVSEGGTICSSTNAVTARRRSHHRRPSHPRRWTAMSSTRSSWMLTSTWMTGSRQCQRRDRRGSHSENTWSRPTGWLVIFEWTASWAAPCTRPRLRWILPQWCYRCRRNPRICLWTNRPPADRTPAAATIRRSTPTSVTRPIWRRTTRRMRPPCSWGAPALIVDRRLTAVIMPPSEVSAVCRENCVNNTVIVLPTTLYGQYDKGVIYTAFSCIRLHRLVCLAWYILITGYGRGRYTDRARSQFKARPAKSLSCT